MKHSTVITPHSHIPLSVDHQWMQEKETEAQSLKTINEIYKPNRAQGRAGAMRQMFFLAYCGRHAQSGRRLLHDEKINAVCTSLKCLTKRLHQRMLPANRNTTPHAIFSKISKPNRAQGRAGAMRQTFFLAYCGRHAQSGRRLFEDDRVDESFFSFTCPTHSTRFSFAETFPGFSRPFKRQCRQKFIKEFKKIGCWILMAKLP